MAENDQSNPNPQGSGGTPPAGTDGSTPPQTPTTPAISDDLKKIIQSENDKLRTHYTQELKKQQAIIDELKQSTMTEAQLRKMKEQQFEEKVAALNRKELELLSVDVLKEHNFSPSLRELIIGKDADETKVRAETLKTEFQKAVEAAVQERFKAAGRDPAKASDPPAAGKGKIYTRAEVDELSKKVTNPSTPITEKASIQAELLAAMREGRIRN